MSPSIGNRAATVRCLAQLRRLRPLQWAAREDSEVAELARLTQLSSLWVCMPVEAQHVWHGGMYTVQGLMQLGGARHLQHVFLELQAAAGPA